MMADLDHKEPPGSQKARSVPKDPAREAQAVAAACEGETGFVPVFGRELSQCRGVDVRGIGDDKVEFFRREPRKQVRVDKLDASLKPVAADVSARHRDRGARNVGRAHQRAWKRKRDQDRKAPGPGAQIERPPHPRGACDPGGQALAQQLGQVRARHDRTLIDVEATISQPGFLDQIGKGPSSAHALFDQLRCDAALDAREFVGEVRRELVVSDPQNVREEPSGFLSRAVRAVPKAHPGVSESPRGIREPVPQPGRPRVIDRATREGALQGSSNRSNVRR